MNHLQVFENQDFGQLRTVIVDGEPWFVAADVCRALEIGETHVAIRRLDEDEKDRFLIPTPGGAQEMSTVNEPGFYSLVLGSRKPEAKAFKRWVTHEVLPTLRKTGSYNMPGVDAGLTNQYLANIEKLTSLLTSNAALLAQSLEAMKTALQISPAASPIGCPKLNLALSPSFTQEPAVKYSRSYKVVEAGYGDEVMELLRQGWTGRAIQEYLREQGVEASEMAVWRFKDKYYRRKAKR